MMRTTLLIGLCCALAAPATAANRTARADFGEFCKTTTSLVPCALNHAPGVANSLTGYDARAADQFSFIDRRNATTAPVSILLAENSQEPKDLATKLKEYIEGLLGKKPAPKTEPKPAPAAAEPATPAQPAAPTTIAQPAKADIEKALAALLAERESWGTAPAGSAVEKPSAPPTVAQPVTGDVSKALSDLFKERESWGTAPAGTTDSSQSTPSGTSASSAPTGNPSSVTSDATGDLGKFIELRESWGTSQPKPVDAPLAKGASKRLDLNKSRKAATGPTDPVIVNAAELPPLPELSLISQADIVRARNALLEERAGWGTKPSAETASVTGDLTAYFERRERWGKGPDAKPVAAPLAKGAKSSFALAGAATQATEVKTVVNAAATEPVPKIADVASDSISASLKQLFATRESWGTEPTFSTRVLAGDLNAYFARRDGWGKGPEPKTVKAPLAKGASAKLRLAKASAPPTDGPDVIVNPLEDRPLPQVGDIPSEKISGAMKALLAEREGWGTEPNVSEALVAGDLNAFIGRRERWGTGPEPSTVKAPLAKGAKRKLKLAENAKPADDTTPVIVNELESRPLPQVADIAPDSIKNALQGLLATRTGWGTEPAISGARFAGDLDRYFARRDEWGKGSKPATVKAPLAKGASGKLRLAKASAPSTDGPDVIVNPLEDRPLPQVGDIPSEKISSAMKALLAERESWGTTPSLSGLPASTAGTETAAVSPKSNISDADRTRCSGELNALANKRTILFGTASAELSASSNAVLDEIAATIKRCGDISVRIEGHTDSNGDADRNQALSEARAKSVLDYLAGTGVKRSKLEAVGYGETKPVASNASRKSRALNRRIEFSIE